MGEVEHFLKTFEFRVGSAYAWEMPFTAIFYAGIKFIFNDFYIYAIRIFQGILLIINAFLVYKISFKIFKDEIIANISFFIMLFYPFFVFYSGLLLSETLFIHFLILAFYFVYNYNEKEDKKSFFLAILCFAFATCTKATLTFLPPIIMAGLVFFKYYNVKKTLKVFVVSFLLYSAFMSVWWVRNYYHLNALVFFTTSSGANLYLGNNRANKEAGIDWVEDIDKKETRKISSIKNEVLRNKAYSDSAKEFILNNPLHFVKMSFKKLKRFYNPFMNSKEYKEQPFYNYLAFISFFPVLVFFILGIFVYRKKFKYLVPIYILVLYFTAIHMVIISSLRYRLPIEPFMIVLAVATVFYFYKKAFK